jgi:uncharacterized protein (TIGR02145 family)
MKFQDLFITAFVLLGFGLTGCQNNRLKDYDGNVYKTVTIGTQVWMAEDLRTTRFNDGTAIPAVTDYDAWASLTTPAYSWYNNDSLNNHGSGLYNWYAIATNKLCPEGWHVPTNEEWTLLGNYFGDAGAAGGELKEAGTAHWKDPNEGATNSSGFTALPGGYRSYNGSFGFQGVSGHWWSATQYSDSVVYFWNMRYKSKGLYNHLSNKPNGFCVRCIQD